MYIVNITNTDTCKHYFVSVQIFPLYFKQMNYTTLFLKKTAVKLIEVMCKLVVNMAQGFFFLDPIFWSQYSVYKINLRLIVFLSSPVQVFQFESVFSAWLYMGKYTYNCG